MSSKDAPKYFQFDAFISYRHTENDTAVAAWLLNALETYKTPKELVRKGFPKKLQRIFRDDDEIPMSSDLSDQIRQALEQSRYLIVICSPDTPASAWVNREIEIFHELGRSDKILVVLIDGEPATSFPKPLFEFHKKVKGKKKVVVEEVEPIAADIRPAPGKNQKDQKQKALLRILSSLLGCRFDDLRQRDRERKKKRRNFALAAATLLAFFSASGGFWYWDSTTRIHTAYFDQMQYRCGVPHGLAPVTEAMFKRRAFSYKFETLGGRVIAVSRVNSVGNSTPNEENVTRWDVRYRAGTPGVGPGPACRAEVDYIILEERNGRALTERHYNDDLTIVQLQLDGYPVREEVGSIPSGSGKYKAFITSYKIEYGESGFEAKIIYSNIWGVPSPDIVGRFGVWNLRNENGQTLEQKSLGPDGQVLILKAGIQTNQFRYSPDGWLIQKTYLNSKNQPAFGEGGYAIKELVYDEFGNPIENLFLDPQGSPTFNNEGFYSARLGYDQGGNLITQSFFGTDKKTVFNKEKITGFKSSYDEKGREVEKTALGVAGQPGKTKNGFSTTKVKYDDKGNVIERTYLDQNGNPVKTQRGYAGEKFVYDENGRVIERTTLGINGKPINLTPVGDSKVAPLVFATTKTTFDESGNEIKIAWYDKDGNPAFHTLIFVAAIKNKFDEKKNIIQTAFFGLDGEPKNSLMGVAEIRSKYGERGNIVEKVFFGVDGCPGAGFSGQAKTTYLYSDNGRTVRRSLQNLDGTPFLDKFGSSSTVSKYNERGDLIESSHFGIDGKLVVYSGGEATVKNKYDARGNKIEQAYFDADGKPYQKHLEYSLVKMKYDVRGNQIEHSYFDDYGQLVLVNGFATAKYKYDLRGDWIEAQYFDPKGQPSLYDASSYDGHSGTYSRRKWFRNELGEVTREECFGLSGEEVSC